MKRFTVVTSNAAPLPRADIDTDQIIPAEFLKRVERAGYGDCLFFNWSTLDNGEPNPMFVLNEPRFKGAAVLLTGPNFGCGSSREHAAWALSEAGFRAIIAPSFADIFCNNCYQNGLLPVRLAAHTVEEMTARAIGLGDYRVTVDLDTQVVTDTECLHEKFDIDPFRRQCLLEGWDDIELTLRHEKTIEAYERERGILA